MELLHVPAHSWMGVAWATPFFGSKCNVKRIFSAALLALATLPAAAENLAETISASPSLRTFSDALRAAGLENELHAGGPYTVFAPSEEAFRKIPRDTWRSLVRDKERLSFVLARHIVPRRMQVTEIKPGDVPTLQGKAIRMTSDNGMVSVEGAKVTQSDIAADNGIIHEVDSLFLPSEDE